ncbi:MAG: AtzE family amidohydrolase [Proteobacteria bacterium]|nr:AtzE family amidohydrolase [Pseudomonadota bacterium]
MAYESALEVAAKVRGGQVRAAAHVAGVFATIKARNPGLNAFISLTESRALAEAKAVDDLVAAGKDPGPLAGVPFAVKNLYDVKGLTTLAGSKINRDLPAAAADSPLVRRLNGAGAVLVGTLNMDEYAYGFTTENTHYGPTRNPHDPGRIAGGSSGGSAAAVAGGLVPITLGSDTNGSIRVPSSLCGIFGLKPTYGRLTRAGSFPFVASLDHLGPFCRSTADLAASYDAMQGPDPEDPVCRPGPAQPVAGELALGTEGLRIARAGGYFEANAEKAVVDLIKAAAAALGANRTVEIPEAGRARAAAFVITATEGSQLHLPNLRTRAGDFEPLIRDRLLANTMIPAAWYVQAQRFRRWYYTEVMKLLREVDVILAPATPRTATLIGQESMAINGVEMLSRPNMGLMTQPISFIGLPVAAVPVGMLDGLPVGMQVICAPWREDLCLRVSAVLEKMGVAKFTPPKEPS